MGVIELIFPKNCLECKKSGMYVCSDCVSKVGKPTPICSECKNPSVDGFTHIKCKTPYGLDGFTSIWNYEGVIRKAIIALKYKYAKEVSRELTRHVVRELKERKIVFYKNTFLVPIPMHRRKVNIRGFNQSFELGKLISHSFGWTILPNLLIRKNPSIPQAQLKGKERVENIKGAFSVNSTISDFEDQNLVIFDDVNTTGSTLKEASKVLKRSGVGNVKGLTVAR